jgi:hypothetical protein
MGTNVHYSPNADTVQNKMRWAGQVALGPEDEKYAQNFMEQHTRRRQVVTVFLCSLSEFVCCSLDIRP